MNILNKILESPNLEPLQNNAKFGFDKPVSLKASVFEEAKPESKLSLALSELEAEAQLLDGEIGKLAGSLSPILRPGSTAPDFVGNDSDSPLARIQDLRVFFLRQRHIIQDLAGRVDL